MPQHSAVLIPTGNGRYTELAIVGGASYAAVLADSDGNTYVHGDGKASVALSDLSPGITNITHVVVRWTARLTPEAAHNVACFIDDGTSEVAGPDHDIDDSDAIYSDTFLTAPDGGAWTVAKANALQIGWDGRSAVGDQRLKKLEAEVFFNPAALRVFSIM